MILNSPIRSEDRLVIVKEKQRRYGQINKTFSEQALLPGGSSPFAPSP